MQLLSLETIPVQPTPHSQCFNNDTSSKAAIAYPHASAPRPTCDVPVFQRQHLPFKPTPFHPLQRPLRSIRPYPPTPFPSTDPSTSCAQQPSTPPQPPSPDKTSFDKISHHVFKPTPLQTPPFPINPSSPPKRRGRKHERQCRYDLPPPRQRYCSHVTGTGSVTRAMMPEGPKRRHWKCIWSAAWPVYTFEHPPVEGGRMCRMRATLIRNRRSPM